MAKLSLQPSLAIFSMLLSHFNLGYTSWDTKWCSLYWDSPDSLSWQIIFMPTDCCLWIFKCNLLRQIRTHPFDILHSSVQTMLGSVKQLITTQNYMPHGILLGYGLFFFRQTPALSEQTEVCQISNGWVQGWWRESALNTIFSYMPSSYV